MSNRTPLSNAVRAVCAAHFNGGDSGCAKCPIRHACHSGPTANLTHGRMEEWRLRLNAAAEKIAGADVSDEPDEIDTSDECVDQDDVFDGEQYGSRVPEQERD